MIDEKVLIERLEELEIKLLDNSENIDCTIGIVNAIERAEGIVNQLAEESAKILIENDLAVIEALPSLYPLQAFEEEAIHRVIESTINTSTEHINCSTDGWIPCSVALPKEQGWYLAHVKHCLNGIVSIEKVLWKKCKYGSWKWYRKGNDTMVIAWMPLPEPYQPKAE